LTRPQEAPATDAISKNKNWAGFGQVNSANDQVAAGLDGHPPNVQSASKPMHKVSEKNSRTTPVTHRRDWGCSRMCEICPDSLHPGCCVVLRRAQVGCNGRQPARQPQVAPESTRLENHGRTANTSRGPLMEDSGLTPMAVALDTGQQRFVKRLSSVFDASKSNELHDYPPPGAQVGRLATREHAHCRRPETMCWPDPGEESVVKTTILEDNAVANRAAMLQATRKESKARSGAWT